MFGRLKFVLLHHLLPFHSTSLVSCLVQYSAQTMTSDTSVPQLYLFQGSAVHLVMIVGGRTGRPPMKTSII